MFRGETPSWTAGALSQEDGFSLVELLIATFVLVGMAGYMFSAMADLHRASVHQGEIQSVTSSARMAMETLQRYVTQAGNNPRGAALEAVELTDSTQVRLRADLTGSSAADPDRGDPDGDTGDLDEDVTVRYRSDEQRIDLVLPDGTVRPVAGGITEFSMQYLDRDGNVTNVNGQVATIRVTMGATARNCSPQTSQRYGIRETFDLRLQSR